MGERFSERDSELMQLALGEAARAAQFGDVPVGAVIASEGHALAFAGNERERRSDPTAHAEMLVLQAAASGRGGWRLPATTLYVTLEPCAMCAGAIVLARVPRVVYREPWTPRPGRPGPSSTSSATPAEPPPDGQSGLLADDAAACSASSSRKALAGMRRTFMSGALAALFLAGCGGGDDKSETTTLRGGEHGGGFGSGDPRRRRHRGRRRGASEGRGRRAHRRWRRAMGQLGIDDGAHRPGHRQADRRDQGAAGPLRPQRFRVRRRLEPGLLRRGSGQGRPETRSK